MEKNEHVDGSVALSVARPTKSNIVIESFELTRSTRSVIEQNPIVIVCSCSGQIPYRVADAFTIGLTNVAMSLAQSMQASST